MAASKRNFLILAAVGMIAGMAALALWQRPQEDAAASCQLNPEATLLVNEVRPLAVDVVDTPDARAQGLAGCQALPPETGMYFAFPGQEAVAKTFWMKGMIMPLDIIWIADGKVIGVERAVPPPADPAADPAGLPRYTSPGPVTAVLELPAGESERLGIDVGAAVLLQ